MPGGVADRLWICETSLIHILQRHCAAKSRMTAEMMLLIMSSFSGDEFPSSVFVLRHYFKLVRREPVEGWAGRFCTVGCGGNGQPLNLRLVSNSI